MKTYWFQKTQPLLLLSKFPKKVFALLSTRSSQINFATPPDTLYNGTADRFVESILKEGLTKQQRRHVHLSRQMKTAKAVGSRHGKPVILHIDTIAMQADGFVFYLSANNVWLVDAVPMQYITTQNEI